MKNNDNGMKELLKLLKRHPELIKELVFDRNNIRSLLRSKAARRLALGQDTTAFLKYVAGPKDGYPVCQCFQQTQVLCAKGTRVSACAGFTKPS